MERLFYNKPAEKWFEALPLGNGNIGLMVFGGVDKELLSVNDDTLWSGYPKDYHSTAFLKVLPDIRKKLFSGDFSKAEKLIRKNLKGKRCDSYLELGEISIESSFGKVNNYKRSLDIKNSLHEVSFSADCGKVVRTSFVSYPDKVAVHRIKSEKPIVNTVITVNSKLRYETISDDGLNLLAQAPDVSLQKPDLFGKRIKYNRKMGMAAGMRIEVKTDGSIEFKGASVVVKNAKTTDIYIVTATGFIDSFTNPSTDKAAVLTELKKKLGGVQKDYDAALDRHIADVVPLFEKVQLKLGESDIPTDVLLERAKAKPEPALIELYYNFGRYMMLAGSRKGTQALNLQGIWNSSVFPEWGSNYTANINVEMNYWPLRACNMDECLEPYEQLIRGIEISGRKTSELNYKRKGASCAHNVDIWCMTTPRKGDPSWGLFSMGLAWLASELYIVYTYSCDSAFLERIYPIIESAALFVSESLIEYRELLVICPGTSPETHFKYKASRCSCDITSTIDMALTREIFASYIQSSDALGKKTELYSKIKCQTEKLMPYEKGKTGIKEWYSGYPVSEKGHRHFSPLIGFFPLTSIGYYSEPEITFWIKELLDYRISNGSGYTGWSAAWALNLYARLKDGDKSFDMLTKLLTNSTFVNLFDSHPPVIFQIDGNFGAVSGINEMLVQSENGIIELLPAVPKELNSGSVKGIRAQGANIIDMKWVDGKVTELNMSKPDAPVRASHLSDELINSQKYNIVK